MIPEESFLIYMGGERFASQLVMDLEDVFERIVLMVFGAPSYNLSTEDFDEVVTLQNDFNNQSFWKEGGSLWETDYSRGYVVAVKVQSRLN